MLAAALALCAVVGWPRDGMTGDAPLWELGAGVAAIDFPDYRGSDERTTYVLPIPYVVYRGEVLKADRDRIRGLFFQSERAELHLSINGSVPVDSSENATRRGMPDLDPTLQFGPNLELKLYRSADSKLRIDLRLPLRTVVATDLTHTKNVGWVFEPRINVDLRPTIMGQIWNLGLGVGPLYGDKRYHNYFFGVPPAFATPDRPAYTADGGYAGVQAIAALSRRYGSFWVGAFARWDTLAGAVFESSPLIRQRESFAAGFAVSWIFSQSQTRVPRDE
ncbi:MAG: MipA/OmpV family protein [Burkholderiales bacterium]